jgi:DNA-binding MarR family transcriptional regulator
VAEIEKQLGAPAMHEASVLLRRILTLNRDVERQLGELLGVNPTDLDAMQHLMASGPLSPGALAQRLGISTAAATVAVDRLVRAGHVRRQPHPTDRRRQLVVPSEASVRRAMASLAPMILHTNDLMGRYDEIERAAITDYLARTVGILESSLEEGLGE